MDRPVTEEDAVLLRRCAQMPVEAWSYRGGSPEPREPAELFDRLFSRLKQYAGSIDAGADPWRLPVFKRARNHPPRIVDQGVVDPRPSEE